MQTLNGPMLMEGDYKPHPGAVEAFEFGLIEDHEDSRIVKAEYQGKKVELNKPRRLTGENKKFGVYVKNDKGNIVQVKFGDPKLDIKRDDPERRRNFRARHNCANPGPKHKARYWSCKMWSAKNVSDILAKSNEHLDEILDIIKQPRTGRSQRGMRAFMTDCRRNALKLRNYEGLQSVRDPDAFCAEIFRNPGKYSGRGPRMTSSRVRDQSGQKLRRALADAGWKPKERLRRGKKPSWSKS